MGNSKPCAAAFQGWLAGRGKRGRGTHCGLSHHRGWLGLGWAGRLAWPGQGACGCGRGDLWCGSYAVLEAGSMQGKGKSLALLYGLG